MQNIRNFCIIAHIDAGKSTLADRFLELTQTVEKRKMQEQFLDQMELERERGITIKLQPVRMIYHPQMQNSKIKNQNDPLLPRSEASNEKIKNYPKDSKIFNFDFYILNLIDTPGHVDFSYEVSRSLAAVEGAILLVDATKGVQAQTIANLALAQRQGLVIIPVINKIDLPTAQVSETEEEISHLLRVLPNEILKISAKTGERVEKVLAAVVNRVPPPRPSEDSHLRALIFDSAFDAYKGVIAYVRVFSGAVEAGQSVKLLAVKEKSEVTEVGYFVPAWKKEPRLEEGEIGYIATGVKDAEKVKVGDTIASEITNYKSQIPNPEGQAYGAGKSQIQNAPSASSGSRAMSRDKSQIEPLPGYQEPCPVVFASFYPEDSDQFDELSDALDKLKLTDASLFFEPENSLALGRGFRLGFLGMLHVEIISERLKREFGLDLIVSSPTVEYEILLKNGKILKIRSASQLPDPGSIESIKEPFVRLDVITPAEYLGVVMKLAGEYRSRYLFTEYLGREVIKLSFEVPLGEIITDFYDRLKSVSSGYASMSYEPLEMHPSDLVRLDILVAGDLVEPFSKIILRSRAESVGRAMVEKLKKVVPPQWFAVALQAAVGGKIIARETIKARRKDVTGYLYGGDVTRKKKLLEKQKRGKARMKEEGRVNIPQKVFLEMLKK